MATKKDSALTTATPVLTDKVRGLDDPSGSPISVTFLLSAIYTLFKTSFDSVYLGVNGTNSAGVRLSLVSGNPNPTTDQSAKAKLYAMEYKGGNIPLWNSSKFVSTAMGGELSADLSAAYQTANNVYDVYFFDDSGTKRIGFGVAWTSATSRGTGAGTAETEVVNGVTVNKNSMTVRNGASSYTVAARYGTVIGSIYPSTSGQLNWTTSLCELSNRYNMQKKTLYAVDATNSWNYSTLTWRAANNSTVNGVMRVTFVACDTIPVYATHSRYAYNSTTCYAATGIALDVTNANSAQRSGGFISAAGVDVPSIYSASIAAGGHYIQAVEISEATGTTTWTGDNNRPTFMQGALIVDIMA